MGWKRPVSGFNIATGCGVIGPLVSNLHICKMKMKIGLKPRQKCKHHHTAVVRHPCLLASACSQLRARGWRVMVCMRSLIVKDKLASDYGAAVRE